MTSIVIPVYTSYNNISETFSTPQSSGTSIIACEFQSGVIIGVDSQVTSGDYINNRIADKLIKIGDGIYCSGFGSTAAIQSIIDTAVYQLNILKNNPGGVSVFEAAGILRGLCYKNRDNLNAEFLIAGCDNDNIESQIYSISSGGMIKRESVFALGSGSPYVCGYVDAHFKINMSRKEAEAFVSKTLALAMSRDNFSGGKMSLAVITKAGVERFEIDT